MLDRPGPAEAGRGRRLRLRIVSWVLYDFASSAYLLLIPAVGYAVFYREIVCGGGPAADARWGAVVALGLGISGVLAPWVGALADLGGLRHPLFVGATVACCAFAASLASHSLIVPPAKANEFFGFNAFASRVSALAGPLLFGAVSSLTENHRLGLASLVLFLAAGAAILTRVRFPDARCGASSSATGACSG